VFSKQLEGLLTVKTAIQTTACASALADHAGSTLGSASVSLWRVEHDVGALISGFKTRNTVLSAVLVRHTGSTSATDAGTTVGAPAMNARKMQGTSSAGTGLLA